jgi:hypothetical protein
MERLYYIQKSYTNSATPKILNLIFQDLIGGSYTALELDQNHRYISEKLNLALVCWQGNYKGVETVWLRWETLDGILLPTKSEFLKQAQSHAAKLAAKLREMGVNSEDF